MKRTPYSRHLLKTRPLRDIRLAVYFKGWLIAPYNFRVLGPPGIGKSMTISNP
jgi:hypothetical protein